MLPKNFSSGVKKGNHPNTFHAPHTSIRQVDGVTGVTVVRVANHLSPLRITSYRRFGITKSMVVVTGPCAPSSLYGRLLLEGACAAMRNPALRPWCSASKIGSKLFSFAWMLPFERH